MADLADNAGGGASSDSTFLLSALLARRITNFALGPFWNVGGKCGPASGPPVDLKVTVRAVNDDHRRTVAGYAGFECGPSVWAATDDGIDLVMIRRRQQAYATDLVTGLGVDVAAKRAIVVKSRRHFQHENSPLAREGPYVVRRGLLRADLRSIPYLRRDLNGGPRIESPWHTPSSIQPASPSKGVPNGC